MHLAGEFLSGVVEENSRIGNRLTERFGRHLPAAYVKTNAHQVEIQLHGRLDQLVRCFHIGAELHAESAHRIGVIGDYAQNTLGIRMVLFYLVQLVLVVERHVVDAHLVGVLDERGLLARIGEYDAIGRDAQVEHTLYFVLAGAVEAGAQKRQQLEQHGVRVAFYSVVRLDAWQPRDPVDVFVANVFEVNNVEWIIF